MSNLKANDFWMPNQQYYTNNRVKSLVLYDDKFYICTENHKSGNTFDVSKFIVVSGSASALTTSEKVKLRGVIDYVGNTEPTEVPDLYVYLTGTFAPEGFNNNTLYVYYNNAWVNIDIDSETEFFTESFGFKIKYTVISENVIKGENPFVGDNEQLDVLFDIINDPANNNWSLCDVASSKVIIVNPAQIGGFDGINIVGAEKTYKDIYIRLNNQNITNYSVNFDYLLFNNIFTLKSNKIYLVNETPNEIKLTFYANEANLITTYPLVSHTITIPANSELCLNLTIIAADSTIISQNTFKLEYVAGNYVKTLSVVLSDALGTYTYTGTLEDIYLTVDSATEVSTIVVNVDYIPENYKFNFYVNASESNTVTFEVHMVDTIRSVNLVIPQGTKFMTVRHISGNLIAY